jgi:hypothetical protein
MTQMNADKNGQRDKFPFFPIRFFICPGSGTTVVPRPARCPLRGQSAAPPHLRHLRIHFPCLSAERCLELGQDRGAGRVALVYREALFFHLAAEEALLGVSALGGGEDLFGKGAGEDDDDAFRVAEQEVARDHGDAAALDGDLVVDADDVLARAGVRSSVGQLNW